MSPTEPTPFSEENINSIFKDKKAKRFILELRSITREYDFNKTREYISLLISSKIDPEYKQIFIGLLLEFEALEKLKYESESSSCGELLSKIYETDMPDKEDAMKRILNSQIKKEIFLERPIK